MVGTSTQLLLMVALIASSCDAYLAPNDAPISFWGTIRQNCGVSIWSKWSPQQDGTTRTRIRTIYSQPQNGGTKCPALSETEANPWNPKRTDAQIAATITTALMSSRFVTTTSFLKRRRRQMQTVKARDFLFIVDMSGSIGSNDFEIVKTNMAKLIEKICGDVGLGYTQNRVAVISFSSNAVINFRFDDHMTLQQVKDAIMSIPYEGQSTCFEKALKEAVNVFRTDAGMRSDFYSVKETIILTDGKWNCGADDSTIYNLVSVLSASTSGLPIAIYAFVTKILPDPVDQEKFDNLVTAPVANHLFVVSGLSRFTSVVNRILQYPAQCAPIIINRK